MKSPLKRGTFHLLFTFSSFYHNIYRYWFSFSSRLLRKVRSVNYPLRQNEVCFVALSSTYIHLLWVDRFRENQCKYCKKILASKQTLKKHITTFHEVDSGKSSGVQCAICDKKFQSRQKLKSHINQNHNKVWFGLWVLWFLHCDM